MKYKNLFCMIIIVTTVVMGIFSAMGLQAHLKAIEQLEALTDSQTEDSRELEHKVNCYLDSTKC